MVVLSYLLVKLAGVGENFIGVVMTLGCAAVVAAYTFMVRPITGRYGALRITAITMFMGAVGLWFVVGIFWKIWVNPTTFFDREPGQFKSLLTLGFWNTTIAQFLWIGGLAAAPDITRGSYLLFFKAGNLMSAPASQLSSS